MTRLVVLFVTIVLIAPCRNINAQTATDFSNVVSTAKTAGDLAKEARNKQTALAAFNAYARGDMDAAFKDFDKDVLFYHSEHSWPHKGLDTMKINAKSNYEMEKKTFPDRQTQLVTANADGDYVMLMFNDSATMKGDMNVLKATGKGYKITDVVTFKFNDAGKIVEQRSILPFTEVRRQIDDGVEGEFNTAGYRLLGEKKYNDAIEVFKLNVKLYPQSANTYDSLGEAYAAAGNKKLALKNYEKAVELNPKNENAKQIIAKLKAGKDLSSK